MSERVVVTASALVCAAGADPAAVWRRVAAGESALGPIRRFDASGWECGVGGEITDLGEGDLVPDRKLHKLIRRTDMLGLGAADRAIAAAGWRETAAALDDSRRADFDDATGVFVGAGGVSYEDQYDFLPLLRECGADLRSFGAGVARAVHPMWLLRALPNNVLGHVGIRHGYRGANACFVNHSSGGALAVLEAAAALRAGKAERALAIAHEAPIEPQRVAYYDKLGLLTRIALRPFDRRHDGSLLGEAGAALCLEREAAARRRGAAVLGEVLGAACVSEGEGLLAVRDDGAGVEEAILLALARSALAPEQVGMIAAHGNGTVASDVSEARALTRVFAAAMPPVTSFKWAVGHTLAASALLDVVLTLESLRRGAVPGIAPLAELDERCGALNAAADARPPRSDVAVVVGRGFAGIDTAIVVRAA